LGWLFFEIIIITGRTLMKRAFMIPGCRKSLSAQERKINITYLNNLEGVMKNWTFKKHFIFLRS